MEKVNSNGVVFSNSSSPILDLTKNLSVKADTSGTSNFKDYVKSNNTNSDKYAARKDNKFEKKEQRDKINDNNDVKGHTSYKKDEKEIKNEGTNSQKETTNNKVIDKADNKKEGKLTLKEEKTESTKEIKSKEEVKNVDNIDENNISAIIAMIVNNNQNSQKIQEELENITPQQATDMLEQLQQMKEMPDGLKNEISDILTTISKGGKIDLSKIVDLTNTENMTDLDDFKSVVDTKELFKKSIEKSSEKSEEILQTNTQDNIGRVSLNQELNNLKNELNFGQKQDEQLENIFVSEENTQGMNSIYTGDGITDVKMMGMNAKVMSNIGKASMNNEQIQNFSKIIDEMKLAFRDDKTTLNIKLQPESLGKLSIKINSENGVFNASFYVESDKAKQAIEQQLHVLRQSLIDQGINIQDINVQVGQNNEDLNYHQNIMEAINFSKKGGSKFLVEDDEFSNIINPYVTNDDLFNDLI